MAAIADRSDGAVSVVPVGWSAATAACAADHCRRPTTTQATLPTPWARSTITWACSMQYHTVIACCTMCRSCCSSIQASGTSAIAPRGSNRSRC